jgi:hypothetical protein
MFSQPVFMKSLVRSVGMAKINNIYIILGIVILVAGGYVVFSRRAQPSPVSVSQPAPTEMVTSQQIIPSDTPTPATNKPVIKAPSAVVGGPAQGQISCNYQIPAGPTAYGTAAIDAKWSNLPAQAAICVSVNGQTPALMSLQNRGNGSAEISGPWLAPNGNYTFGLYNGSCTGVQLSSCQVRTMMPPVQTPRPSRP